VWPHKKKNSVVISHGGFMLNLGSVKNLMREKILWMVFIERSWQGLDETCSGQVSIGSLRRWLENCTVNMSCYGRR
jgi:hypothetical protein